ncbi:MAG TPA: HAMP domain-containing sensor histidine kinase [Candidatus Limnocylindrales bacterium]|nr:HAMP domain-containing sensor histidine kinase [Candidatus Limnocylindrales bacterium]
MKKVALLFVLAVFLPSLLLAWLAVRSLRDQQFLLERQESLLYQGTADGTVKDILAALGDIQHSFAAKVGAMLEAEDPRKLATSFDALLRHEWPLAEVGFVVTTSGEILSPSPQEGPTARAFLTENSRFLANRESAEVYLNSKQPFNNALMLAQNDTTSGKQNDASVLAGRKATDNVKTEKRYVVPQQMLNPSQRAVSPPEEQQVSKLSVSEAEFRQLIGEQSEGMLARFIDNKLQVILWFRSARDSQLVFGAQLGLGSLQENLRPIIQQVEAPLRDEICMALLNDAAKPVALSHSGFQANWKHPFVASEIGEALPHWEVAVYLLNPAKLARSAEALKWMLGLLVAVLVTAIGIGSWLLFSDLSRQLRLARQKTDFVSNVSHELKTPLTSIRMFAELLAEGRVADPARQRSYLNIITAESARLTRLINNVLDFARIERGEKKYTFQRCDLAEITRETADSYLPHLEANGFTLDCHLPSTTVWVNGDRDALAQIIVNLLSNAEKYSGAQKEVVLRLEQKTRPLPYAQIEVLDRGLGVPAGSEEKIFEKFYRAHDSLSSGIQGSGLGLTLARQIARAHGGDVLYEPREGGGSCFRLHLPVTPEHS